MGRFFLVVIDGLGIGAQEDADQYGDESANTLAGVSRSTQCKLPNFEKLGLGNIEPLPSIPAEENPAASFGKMREVSAGKDSTTGHWELAGLTLEKPFPTYPDGFPEDVISRFCTGTGNKGVLCNKPYSGTDVIRDYGKEHLSTGRPIVYTSADSVFQVACHTDITPVDTLYEWCKYAREEVLVNEHAVGRVIARPFEGKPGSFERISEERKDFSKPAPQPNLLSLLQAAGIKTYSIGKVIDLFAFNGFDQYRKTRGNAEGISQLLSLMSAGIDKSFTFMNLIDTDQLYGHRQNPEGFAEALQEIDRALPAILSKMKEDDIVIFTGDHGNDPTDQSTDHTREFVPLLVISGQPDTGSGENLGIRNTFADVSASVLDFFECDNPLAGYSFMKQIREK
ncbi:MAG: phosphopentomutase [Balneolaceae bacterium]|nr:phosphopentomutase [Balneolaceae bacterium]